MEKTPKVRLRLVEKTPKGRLRLVKRGTEEVIRRRVFAYLRVSTGTQDVGAQRTGIVAHAAKHDLQPLTFVDETESGAIPAAERTLGRELLPRLRGGTYS